MIIDWQKGLWQPIGFVFFIGGAENVVTATVVTGKLTGRVSIRPELPARVGIHNIQGSVR